MYKIERLTTGPQPPKKKNSGSTTNLKREVGALSIPHYNKVVLSCLFEIIRVKTFVG